MKTHLKIIAIVVMLLSKTALASSNIDTMLDCFYMFSASKTNLQKCLTNDNCSNNSQKELIKSKINEIDLLSLAVFRSGIKEFGSEEKFKKYFYKVNADKVSVFENRWNKSTVQERQDFYNLCERQFK